MSQIDQGLIVFIGAVAAFLSAVVPAIVRRHWLRLGTWEFLFGWLMMVNLIRRL